MSQAPQRADSTPKRPESALVVVYTAGGEVLLLERREPAGWWQSVTGSLEAREQPWEAAVRELAEETGLSAAGLLDLGLCETFTIAPAWRHRFAPGVTENREHAFALRIAAPVEVTLDPLEHIGYAWLPLAAAVERATSSTNRAAIERVGEFLAAR
ncbi:MAG: dihydroneopterin triphosphate diphosphatase [Gammaproteobacteria bacterium]